MEMIIFTMAHIVVVKRQIDHETAVNFNSCSGRREVAQAGVAGAEVVHRAGNPLR